jgi:hypothetical protein
MADANKVYDIVISGGRVIDPETGLDAIRNVGVTGEKIAIVTEDDISGKDTIDATGLVVSPGFIDMHFHNLAYGFGEHLALRDGVTTPLELELGVYPVSEWYDAVKGKCRCNYGASVSTMAIRERLLNPNFKEMDSGQFLLDLISDPSRSSVSMNWSKVQSTPEQIEQFESMLDEGLSQGSIGVGHAVGYAVDGCSQQESMVAQKMAGKYGASTYVHARFSGQQAPTSGILGFMEMMGPQEAYGGGIVFQHMTAQALRDSVTALEMFDRANERSIPIIGEIYPYNYGASIVAADYLHPDNYQNNMGRDYGDIIEIANLKPLTKERYEELVPTIPTTPIMFYNATEEDVFAGLSHPSSVVGSDAFSYTIRETGETARDWDVPFDSVNGHPRGAGSHARVLAWTREKKLDIPLTLAVSKMTYMIADYMEANGAPQMANKGRIQVGKDADITIFDPEKVQDNATMEDGGLPSTGIPFVLVNGTVMVRDSVANGDKFPGKPIYGSATVA